MSDTGPGPATIGLAVLIAVTLSVVTWFGLSALSRPADFDMRIAGLRDRAADLERRARLPGDASAHPPGAVCAGLGQKELDAVQRALASLAQPGMTIQQVSVAPQRAGEPQRRLTPIQVNLVADGRYDSVMTFLGHLNGIQPELFVDSLDLSSRTSSVELKLSGKVFCWTSAAS